MMPPSAASVADDRRRRIRAFLDAHGLDVTCAELVSQALTHRSYAFEHDEMPDSERMEFLGDAVVGCVAADFLYRAFPEDAEGTLSKKKGYLVSRTELGRRAEELGLASLVLLGRGEENSGGRQRLSIVGSALEALVGALFLEKSLDCALNRFIEERILKPALPALQKGAHLDYKSRLQEFLQKNGPALPVYRKTGESGPAHKRVFSVDVYVADERLGTGEGQRIKTAENRAARQAYEALVRRCE